MADTVHWADVIAEKLLNEKDKQNKKHKQIVAVGITPSDSTEIGSLREAVTADAICKAFLEKGEDAGLICIANTFSPLHRVYPFLPESYFEHVGKPLSEIPCPCGACTNYAEHFLRSALDAWSRIGVNARVYRTDEMYRAGIYNEVIGAAFTERDTIDRILEGSPGKTREPGWSSFLPRCEECGLITKTKVTGFNPETESLDYTCTCGHSGTIPLAGGGKLDLCMERPASWAVLGVTVEVSGKKRASTDEAYKTDGNYNVDGNYNADGAYKAGKRIAEEIYGYSAPYPVICEQITTGKRGMTNLPAAPHKKTAATVSDLLAVMPPEFARYLIIRTKPEKQMNFDPGQALLAFMEEYEHLRAQFRSKDSCTGVFKSRIYELSRFTDKTGTCQPEIPFRQMAAIYQAARRDYNRTLEIVSRAGYNIEDEKDIKELIENVSRWLELYAPPFMKFSVKEKVPVQAATLSAVQKAFLSAFAAVIKSREEISAAEYHMLVYSAVEEGSDLNSRIIQTLNIQIAEQSGLKNVKLQITPGNLFKAIYISMLGQSSGPRAGWFLSAFDREFLVKRFEEASNFSPGAR